MKKTHIIGIVLIAIAIGCIFTLLGNSSTYSDFATAAASGDEVHVAGSLDRAKPMEYDAVADPNRFAFWMIDKKGLEKHVVLTKSKPQDFERSQQVVVVGAFKGDEFIASDVLMKCPSKYNNGQDVPNN
ncbi:MAG TPA: cytochrome c maturation protein CcmE [Bacteroidia bacterium]|jgi:cytochrome c-type biogenesis protein CcmE|nr:cytochrome c maturation protein CcmE [Bacteroidia bacterium]